MADESSASIPPELRVSLDLEIVVGGLNSNADHQTLESALAHVPGVESIIFPGDKVEIRYDPERVTKAELSARIVAAGFRISASSSASLLPHASSEEES